MTFPMRWMVVPLIFGQAMSASAQDLLPQGGSITAGSAVIDPGVGGNLAITQSSDRAIIDWTSFSVGAGNRVTFALPSSGGATLNRVTGGTSSTLAGQVFSNGQVFLVNPNGIFITPQGEVRAQGFVASTLGIEDQDFMSGDLRFAGQGGSARVTNAGRIIGAEGGFAALLGGAIENSGTIAVPLGRIGLGAGERATLDLDGDGFLQVAMPSAGYADGAVIEHSGAISADGGMVVITAATARDAARHVVNLPGSVSARSVSGRNGAIVFGAGAGGQVAVSGQVDASAGGADTGGRIDISGESVTLQGAEVTAASEDGAGGFILITGDQIAAGAAQIDASGATGGGTILIGGGAYGLGGFRRARILEVDNATSLQADAHRDGKGGTVVLWSDVDTRVFGAISARGGAEGGDGGFAEVSSAGRLTYSGTADLRADRGRIGDLLLDPYNITISSAADGGVADFTANADDSNINTTTLQTALATANVTVSTGVGGTQAGNITLLDALTWASGTQLTFDAANNISLSAPINATGGGGLHLVAGNDITLTNAIGVGFGSGIGVLLQAGNSIIGASGASITTQGQAVTLNSDRDESGAGAIALTNTTITSNGGDVTLSGGAGDLTDLQTTGFARGLPASGLNSGILLDAGSQISAGTGDVVLRGMGSTYAGFDNNGVFLRDSLVSTTTGSVQLVGTAGGNGTNIYQWGVLLNFGAGVTSAGGDITVRGVGGTTVADNQAGVALHLASLTNSGHGAITIDATAPTVATGANVSGFRFFDGASIRSNGTGPITLTATQGNAPQSILANAGTNSVGLADLSGSYTGTITVNADAINLSVPTFFTGSGALAFQPITPGATIGLGDGASGTLNLDAIELGYLQDGFSSITIGSANGSGAVDIRNATFRDPVTIRTPTGTGSITLNGALATGGGSEAGSVTLQAGDSIIGNSGASITTQGQAVTLNPDRDESGAGSIALTATDITTNGGNIALGGGADPETGAAWSSGANLSGVSISGGELAASTGSITISGRSSAAGYGVVLRDAATVSTTTGDIGLSGVGGTSGGFAVGVMMTTGGSSVTTTDGRISISGTGGTSSGNFSSGVRLDTDQTVVEATGSGSISITGVGGENSSGGHGVVVASGPNARLRTTVGDMTLTGTARWPTAAFGVLFALQGGAEVGSGDLTINGFAATTASGAIGSQVSSPIRSTGGGDIILNGNSLNFAGPISGNGQLVIQPTSPETTIGIGSGAVGEMNLNDTELSLIGNGFSSITIGSANGSGAVDIRNATFRDPVTIRTPTGTGSITLNGALATGGGSEAGSVTLQAGDSIIGTNGASITTQGAGVTLNSDRDDSGAGAIALTSTTIATNGGNVALGGGLDPETGAARSSGGYLSGVSLSGGSIAAAAGSISVSGRSTAAGYGILLREGVSLSTSSGDIDLTGIGGTSSTYAVGVMMTTGGASVSSVDGDITVMGTGGTSTGAYSAGVRMNVDPSVIEATGSGSVTITGVGGANSQYGHGVLVGSGPNSRVRTASGTLTIHGTALSADGTYGAILAVDSQIETGSGDIMVTGLAPLGATAAVGSQSNSMIRSTGGGDITLNGNSFGLAGGVSGTGQLLIQPTSPETTIGLGNGSVGDLNLSTSELGLLQNGFAGITIGSATGTGAMHLRTWAATDPLLLRSLSGNVNLNGAVSTGSGTSSGSITIATGGTLTGAAASSITTQGQAITLTGAPVSGAMALASNGAPITIMQTGSGSISGILGGAGSSLVKDGSGTLTLTASNSYSGGTMVTAGTLAIGAGAGGLLGSGSTTVASGARLSFDTTAYHGGANVISGSLLGSGIVEIGGASSNRIIRFSGDNSAFSGTFQLNAGARATLQSATAGSAMADFVIDGQLTPQVTGATLQFGSLSGTGIVSLGGGTSNTVLEIGANGRSTSFSGSIGNVADSISLRKVGAGTLTLAGALTHTGATMVEEGVLTLSGTWNRNTGTATVSVDAGAALNGAGIVTANTLSHSGAGQLSLTGSNAIRSLSTSGTVGAITLNNTGSLSLGAINSTGALSIVTTGATADLTLAQPITTTATGEAVLLSAGRSFINSAGASAITTGAGGRYLVYAADWAGTAGGLTAGRLYNRSYAAHPPASITQAGSQLIYAAQPILTFTAEDATRVYGATDPVFTASLGGLVNGDTAAQAYGGALAFGTTATTASGVGSYAITVGAGAGLASEIGYGFAFVDGTLDVTARPITVTADDLSRPQGGANPALTYRIGGLGLVGGDTLSGGLATLADVSSAPGDYAITQGTLTASANYALSFVDGTLTVLTAAQTLGARSLPAASRFLRKARPLAMGEGEGLAGAAQGNTDLWPDVVLMDRPTQPAAGQGSVPSR